MSEATDNLQALQRERVWYMKTCIMLENRLVATVANAIGYSTTLTEKERKKAFDDARKHIKQVQCEEIESPIEFIITSSMSAIDGFRFRQRSLEPTMEKLMDDTPLAGWADEIEQRGISSLSLAKIIGETGDLWNYDNPAKLWKRMGCAPYEKDGVVKMGSTWKRKELTAEEWSEFGYSKRRRSVMYVIGEGLIKQNNGGPYRSRYDEARQRFAEKHPDATKMHCHRHGMLLASKLLLKRMWQEWRK